MRAPSKSRWRRYSSNPFMSYVHCCECDSNKSGNDTTCWTSRGDLSCIQWHGCTHIPSNMYEKATCNHNKMRTWHACEALEGKMLARCWFNSTWRPLESCNCPGLRRALHLHSGLLDLPASRYRKLCLVHPAIILNWTYSRQFKSIFITISKIFGPWL